MAKYTDEFIRSYLQQQLSPAVEERFERALEDNEALRARTDDMRYLVLSEDLVELENTRALLKASRKPGGLSSVWPWAIVLAVLVVALLYGAYSNYTPSVTRAIAAPPKSTQPISPQPEEKEEVEVPVTAPIQEQKELAPPAPETDAPTQETEDPERPPVFAMAIVDTVRSVYQVPKEVTRTAGGAQDTSLLAIASQSLANGTYEKAQTIAQALLKDNPNDVQAKKILAHSYFSQGDFVGSSRVFRDLVAAARAPNRDKYEWYLLLSMLAERNALDAETRVLFEAILDPEAEHNFQRPAKRLLERIDR